MVRKYFITYSRLQLVKQWLTDFQHEITSRFLDAAKKFNIGTIGVRILAGGVLTGTSERHPLSLKKVKPLGSGPDYDTDVNNSQLFTPLIE